MEGSLGTHFQTDYVHGTKYAIGNAVIICMKVQVGFIKIKIQSQVLQYCQKVLTADLIYLEKATASCGQPWSGATVDVSTTE